MKRCSSRQYTAKTDLKMLPGASRGNMNGNTKETHRCNFCGLDKPRSEFSEYRYKFGMRLNSRCKSCIPEYRRINKPRHCGDEYNARNHAHNVLKNKIQRAAPMQQIPAAPLKTEYGMEGRTVPGCREEKLPSSDGRRILTVLDVEIEQRKRGASEPGEESGPCHQTAGASYAAACEREARQVRAGRS